MLKRAVEKYGRKNCVDTRELMQILDYFPGKTPKRAKKQARHQVTPIMNNERVATTGVGRCVSSSIFPIVYLFQNISSRSHLSATERQRQPRDAMASRPVVNDRAAVPSRAQRPIASDLADQAVATNRAHRAAVAEANRAHRAAAAVSRAHQAAAATASRTLRPAETDSDEQRERPMDNLDYQSVLLEVQLHLDKYPDARFDKLKDVLSEQLGEKEDWEEIIQGA